VVRVCGVPDLAQLQGRHLPRAFIKA